MRVGVGQASVSVAGPHILYAAKIRRHGGVPTGTDSVNGARQRPFLAALDIEDAADIMVAWPVIPENFGLRAGPPLEHATLLPAPGAAVVQLNPPVGVLLIPPYHKLHIAAIRGEST